MSRIEEIKTNLKRLAADNLEQALKETARVLSNQSPVCNTILLLQGQFNKCREDFLMGILGQEQSAQIHARITAALLHQIGSISESDIHAENGAVPKPAEKRGELLYHVPHTMQLMREVKCTVRIAWTKNALFENWTSRKEDIQRSNLRIAEIMGVELLNPSEDSPFSIKTLHSTVQFLDNEDYTEWIFYVKPLQTGNFPLVIRISVIEMRDNREVKRELVLEEQINVATEGSEAETDRGEMMRAPMAYFAAGGFYKESPVLQTGGLRRYGTLLILLLFSMAALFIPRGRDKDDLLVVKPDPIDSMPGSYSESVLPRFAQSDTGQSIPKEQENHISQKPGNGVAVVQERRKQLAMAEKSRHEQARKDKIKSSGLGTGGTGQGSNGGGKPGNQGVPGGTGSNPFGQNTGSGGGTGSGTDSLHRAIESVRGGLSGRRIISKPVTKDSTQKQGTVRVKLCVDSGGCVVSAEPTQAGSTTTDKGLRSTAMHAAMQFRFEPAPGADVQCGWVDFNFTLK